MTDQLELMFKTNLGDYMATGLDMPTIEAYYKSLALHISYVREAGMLLGVSWPQLFVHDASKFTTIEFPYYARQFYGDEGDPAGFAVAWLHHQNHNMHHWEYWIMRSGHEREEATTADKTTGCLPMPNHYAREMVADWMGASKAYNDSWSVRKWWQSHKNKIRLHPNTRLVVETILKEVDYGD